MSRSKKIFFFIFVLFVISLIVITWDMGRRTTFPGSKAQLPARIEKQMVKDSVKR